MARIAVLGGNGFVGQRVLEKLIKDGHKARCFSRTGDKPLHMSSIEFAWSDQVEWIKADGARLPPSQLEDCDGLICVVGAPPIPRLGSKAIQRQRALNAEANIKAIQLAGQVGIKRVALLGAKIPCFLRNRYFGYFLGKRDSLRAAKVFSDRQEHHAAIIQPWLIMGRRYLKNGKAIPLDILSRPFLPFSFGLLQKVEDIADALVSSVLGNECKPRVNRIIEF